MGTLHCTEYAMDQPQLHHLKDSISDPDRRMFTVDREFITLNYIFEVATVNVDGTGPYSTPPLTVDTAVPSGNILSLLFY